MTRGRRQANVCFIGLRTGERMIFFRPSSGRPMTLPGQKLERQVLAEAAVEGPDRRLAQVGRQLS